MPRQKQKSKRRAAKQINTPRTAAEVLRLIGKLPDGERAKVWAACPKCSQIFLELSREIVRVRNEYHYNSLIDSFSNNAKVTRLIVRLHEKKNRLSFGQIADHLNDRGFRMRNRRPWNFKAVQRLYGRITKVLRTN
jgi:hypothetical protein